MSNEYYAAVSVTLEGVQHPIESIIFMDPIGFASRMTMLMKPLSSFVISNHQPLFTNFSSNLFYYCCNLWEGLCLESFIL